MINRIIYFSIAFFLAYLDPASSIGMCCIAGLLGRVYIAVWLYLNYKEVLEYINMLWGLLTKG
jgi:hypothetical protein